VMTIRPGLKLLLFCGFSIVRAFAHLVCLSCCCCYNDRQKNDLENTTQETKDPPWITLENGGEVMWFGKVSSFCSTSDTRRVIIKRHNNNSSDIQGEQMLIGWFSIEYKPVLKNVMTIRPGLKLLLFCGFSIVRAFAQLIHIGRN
jgi:hypothetical protein